MTQQYEPALNKLINEFISICDESRTGTLFVVNNKNYSIQIRIEEGRIVDASDRDILKLKSGSEKGINLYEHHAIKILKKLKNLKDIRFHFSENFMIPQHEASLFDFNEIKSNEDIFNEIGLDVSFFEKESQKIILIIDDSRIARKIAKEALSPYHYRIIEAESGEKGLIKIAEHRPDQILLDIIMPVMDGYKVLTYIKNNKKLEHIPVIMLTSRNKLFDKIKGKLSDANEYLTKPFVNNELINKVNHYLE
jgi:twitching motility two-component system response regulator PilG